MCVACVFICVCLVCVCGVSVCACSVVYECSVVCEYTRL